MKKFYAYILLAICIVPFYALSSSAAVRAEKNSYFIDDAHGSAVIKNGNKQKARSDAKKAAEIDAINKAVEMFAGSIDGEIKNRVLAKSQSMIKNFKITSETVDGDTLTITASCSVSEKAFDGVLGPEVVSMLGNPRVMIIVDDSSGRNASVAENELLRTFEKAGYLIVDKEQAQALTALDPKKAFSDPELLAAAAKTARADIIIAARASSSAAHAERFGIHMYKPSASVQVKAVLTKTAYQISSSTISRGSQKWQGSSSAAGLVSSCIHQAAEEIIYKIAYRMASAGSALGGVTVNINLAGASFRDIEKFTEYLAKTGSVFERSYTKELAEIDLVSPKNARSVASLISDYSLPGGIIEVEGLTAQTVTARVKPSQHKEEVISVPITTAPPIVETRTVAAQLTPPANIPIEEKAPAVEEPAAVFDTPTPAPAPTSAPAPVVEAKPEVKHEVKYVVINIFLDKLGENDARKIENELSSFIGQAGEVQGEYHDPELRINVRVIQGSEDTKNVDDIEAFLKNDMKSKGVELLVDKPEGNSIKGSRPGGILDRFWW